MESKPTATSKHTMNAEQVAALVESSEQATAKNIGASAGDVWQKFVDYVEICKGEEPARVPTFTGFSHLLGFASERGYRYLAEKGGDYPAVMKRIDEAIIEGVAQRMMAGRANQVGCIFWLKNKAGYRDKQLDEIAAENDDWLHKVHSFAAIAGRMDAKTDAAAAAPTSDGDAAELLLFESGDDTQDAAAGG